MRCVCLTALAASGVWAVCQVAAWGGAMSVPTTILPFQPASMSTSQLAAVAFLACHAGRTHALCLPAEAVVRLCAANGLDPLVGIQRAHVVLCIRGRGDWGLMEPPLWATVSSTATSVLPRSSTSCTSRVIRVRSPHEAGRLGPPRGEDGPGSFALVSASTMAAR